MQRPLRLRHSADFARSRRIGRVWRQPLLHLSVVSNGLAHNRYGFITGKVIGGAVVRNRVRRQLREVLRGMHPQLRPGYDLVWITRNGIAAEPYSHIKAIVLELIRRAGLIKPEESESGPEL
jgi:ribonuclease P protein component